MVTGVGKLRNILYRKESQFDGIRVNVKKTFLVLVISTGLLFTERLFALGSVVSLKRTLPGLFTYGTLPNPVQIPLGTLR